MTLTYQSEGMVSMEACDSLVLLPMWWRRTVQRWTRNVRDGLHLHHASNFTSGAQSRCYGCLNELWFCMSGVVLVALWRGVGVVRLQALRHLDPIQAFLVLEIEPGVVMREP